jgi:hypothetical protein
VICLGRSRYQSRVTVSTQARSMRDGSLILHSSDRCK